MPDFASRDEYEQRLARALSRLGRQLTTEIMERLGSPPDSSRLDAAFWDDVRKRYSNILLGDLEQVYIEAARGMEDVEGVPPTDEALLNEAAVTWASAHVERLVSQIDSTNQRGVQRAVDQYFRQGTGNVDLLEQRVSNVFNVGRAGNTAITEVTNAVSNGEQSIVRQLRSAGVTMVAVFNTANDDRVCAICEPLDQTKQGEDWMTPPPLHTGCRCWLSYEVERA